MKLKIFICRWHYWGSPNKNILFKNKKRRRQLQTDIRFIYNTYIHTICHGIQFVFSFFVVCFIEKNFYQSTFRRKCFSLSIAVIRKLFTFWLEDKQNNFVCFASIPLKALLRVYWLFKAVEYWQLKGCKSLEKKWKLNKIQENIFKILGKYVL